MALSATQKPALRVLQMTARADMGGGPRHLFDLLRGLETSNIQNFVASPLDEPFAPKFRAMASGFVEIPHRQFSPFVLLKLARFVRTNDIAVIHSHGRGAGYYSRFLGLMTSRPVVHTYHGVFVEKPIAARLKLFADRLLAFLPFFGLFVSNSERVDASNAGVIRKQQNAVLPNAVDLARFSEAAKPLRPQVRRVGAFLRPTKQKGPDLYLDLARGCLDLPWAAQIVFECAGITLEQLEAFGDVPPNVRVRGVVNEPATWLAELDLFVSTARHEGLPIGVLEAMAAQTPCLISDITAHQQFIDAQVAESLVLSRSLPQQLEMQMSRPVDLQATAGRAQKFIQEGFSLGAFSKQLITIYEGVMREWSSPESADDLSRE